MTKLSDTFWNFISSAKKWKIFTFIFLSAIILRINTAFIDYIHIDVITTYNIIKRDFGGLDFSPNKKIVYHNLFKWSLQIFGDSPTSFHIVGIIFILLTMFFIYLLGKKIYSQTAGIIAAMFYGFVISSYNIEFMATNAEVIYNLFFIAAFYFFYLIINERKFISIIPLIISILLAVNTKVQGTFCIMAIIGFAVFTWPFFLIKKDKSKKIYYTILVSSCIIVCSFILIDWNISKVVFQGSFREKFQGMVNYVSNRGFSPVSIIGRLIWKGAQFVLYHSIVWVPGTIVIIRFFRKKDKNIGEGYLVTLSIFLFLTIFSGGARLSIHYFIPTLPVLSILAASFVSERINIQSYRKLFFIIFMVPVLFYFTWNMKDLYIMKFKPEWKHNESKLTYFFRQIMISSHGEYLLPYKELLPVIDFLKNETDKDETIFVWPMGSEVVYYSQRTSATPSFWYNEGGLVAMIAKEKGSLDEYMKIQKSLIKDIIKRDPDYFVDVGCTSMIRKVLIYRKKSDPPDYFDPDTMPMIRYGSFGKLDDLEDVMKFLNKEYKYIGNFGKSRVWKKKVKR